MPIITMESIVSMYLYGTETPPKNLEDRLRSDDITSVSTSPDVEQYMAVVGRFTNLYQTEVVKQFFSGNVDLSQFSADANGVKTVTLDQMLLHNEQNTNSNGITIDDAQVSVSQYTAGINDADWAFRAFVFGSTSFRLSGNTQFIDDNGTLSIRGGSMVPYDDGFDLVSGNPAAQLFNYIELQNLIDPYRIGKEVLFEFNKDEVNSYINSHSSDIYYASGAPSPLADFIGGIAEVANFGSNFATVLLGNSTLISAVEAGAQYIADGHNIVFGTNGNNELNASSLTWPNADNALPITYIAGEGVDRIDVGSDHPGDQVYASDGDDIIRVGFNSPGDIVENYVYTEVFSGAGNDTVFVDGGNNIIDLGSGDDSLVFGINTPSYEGGYYLRATLGLGKDTVYLPSDGSFYDEPGAFGMPALSFTYDLKDVDDEDSIVWNGHLLTGGSYTVFEETTNWEYLPGSSINGAAAWLGDLGEVYNFDSEMNVVEISLPDGSIMYISEFTNGDLGMSFDEKKNYLDTESGYVNMTDNGWIGVPRANVASTGEDFGQDSVDLYYNNLHGLDGRLESFSNPGTHAAPSELSYFA